MAPQHQTSTPPRNTIGAAFSFIPSQMRFWPAQGTQCVAAAGQNGKMAAK